MYVEDFYKIDDFTKDETKMLERDVYIHSLPTKDEYINLLEDAGFKVIQWVDMTKVWTDFVASRYNDYLATPNTQLLPIE